MLDFPNTPNIGDRFDAGNGRSWRWDGVKWTDGGWQAPSVPGRGGRLVYETPTSVRFIPYNGDQIQIDGQIYQIPAGGLLIPVAGVAGNNALVFLHAPSGHLAAHFMTVWAGNPVGDYHETSMEPGNVGVQVLRYPWGGAPPYTLIGMVWCDENGEVADTPLQRHVLSWFNRQDVDGMRTWAGPASPSGTPTVFQQTTISLLTWGDEAVRAFCEFTFTGLNMSGTSEAALWVCYDGDVNNRFGVGQRTGPLAFTGTVVEQQTGGFEFLSEGRHEVALAHQILSGSGSTAPTINRIAIRG